MMRFHDANETARHDVAIVVHPIQHIDFQRQKVFMKADPATCGEDGSPICPWYPSKGLPTAKLSRPVLRWPTMSDTTFKLQHSLPGVQEHLVSKVLDRLLAADVVEQPSAHVDCHSQEPQPSLVVWKTGSQAGHELLKLNRTNSSQSDRD